MTTCSVCPLYGRDGDQEAKPPRPPANRCDPGWSVCGYCHGRISAQLKEIPDLHSILDATPGSTVTQDQITGSQEISLGVRVGVLDLMVVAERSGTVHDAHGDQAGQIPVIAVLDAWVEDWRATRAMREHRPVPTVATLTQWLLHRLDWASQNHPAMDDMAQELKTLTGALYAATGHSKAKPEHKRGVPCPRCDRMVLYRDAGDDYVECKEAHEGCGNLMSPAEYERWVGLYATGRAALRVPDHHLVLPV